MAAESRSEQDRKYRRGDPPKPSDSGSQGIVRDQRGQEQPVDKERAQQTSKNE